MVAGTITLMLGSATAAAAATGTLQDIIDDALGTKSDHAWAMDITVRGEVWACTGGIAVLPYTDRPDYVEADYLAVKRFIQEHDWSDLRPDESLLGSRFKTAETLALTADRHMSLVAQQAGLNLNSTQTRGFASCEKK